MQGSETGISTHDRAGAQINRPARPLEIVFGRGAEKRSVTYQGVGLGVTLADAVRSARTCVRTELRRNSVRGSVSLQRGAAPAPPAVVCAGAFCGGTVLGGLWQVVVHSVAAGGQSAANSVQAGDRLLRIVRPIPLATAAAYGAADSFEGAGL